MHLTRNSKIRCDSKNDDTLTARIDQLHVHQVDTDFIFFRSVLELFKDIHNILIMY